MVGVKSLFHLAARVHVIHGTDADPLTAFRSVNVDGTLSLACQAAAAGVKRFVFVSSIQVNGEFTPPGRAYAQADRPNPQDAYGQSKHQAEQGLRQLSVDTGMEIVIIRPPLVYGPGFPARLLPVPVWALQARASLLGKGDAVQRLGGNLQVDMSKARSLVGWVPPVSEEEGLRRAMAV